MKRLLDVILSVLVALFVALPMLVIALGVKFTSSGPVFYWSDRVGQNNRIFRMPKFRTMKVETPALATHLLKDPTTYLTPIGPFLRKYSIDELPQLWSIFNGDMSFVGPRPALFNQNDLIKQRSENGTEKLLPGLTGWAQINGRDDLSISDKVALDYEYLQRRSFLFDCYIMWKTAIKVVNHDDVSH